MYQNRGQENAILLKKLEKRRNLYTIVFVILFLLFSVTGWISALLSGVCFVLMGICAGFGLLAINCFRYYKTGGRKQGGGLWWILLMLFGGIVVPIVTVVIVSKIDVLVKLILGVEME